MTTLNQVTQTVNTPFHDVLASFEKQGHELKFHKTDVQGNRVTKVYFSTTIMIFVDFKNGEQVNVRIRNRMPMSDLLASVKATESLSDNHLH